MQRQINLRGTWGENYKNPNPNAHSYSNSITGEGHTGPKLYHVSLNCYTNQQSACQEVTWVFCSSLPSKKLSICCSSFHILALLVIVCRRWSRHKLSISMWDANFSTCMILKERHHKLLSKILNQLTCDSGSEKFREDPFTQIFTWTKCENPSIILKLMAILANNCARV